jgi:hypothetical protein
MLCNAVQKRLDSRSCEAAKHQTHLLRNPYLLMYYAACCCSKLGYYTLGFSDSSSSNTKASNCSQQQASPAASSTASPFAAPQPTISSSSSNHLQGDVGYGSSSQAMPVLFLHGVGGLLPYLEMLVQVVGLGHPVILAESKHVSLRLW